MRANLSAAVLSYSHILIRLYITTTIAEKVPTKMAEEKSPAQQQEAEVIGTDPETRSNSSSEAARNPFDDGNKAASVKSIARSMDTTTQAETPAVETESSAQSQRAPLPSYSPLVFSNYPPLWTSDKSRPKPTPRASSSSQTHERSQSGFSAATLSAVMSAGSKEDSARGKRFKERDPSNRHEYIQAPERKTESHGSLNIFGRDIGGLGKRPPSMRFRRQKGK